MSIIKSIKDTGLDIFISYHPIVVKLKRESKELHKELKLQNFSLMQCQEIIAKRYGFNNWYHFFQLIKKYYQVGIENIPFIITTKLEKNEHFLVGYDINFGHYKWQNTNSMKTHHCIIGQYIYKDYDLFLALQAIEKGNEVFFINGINDMHTNHDLVEHAIAYRRDDNLKVIGSNSKQKLYNHFNMGSGGLSEIIYSCLDIDDDFNRSLTISFLSSMLMGLVYKRDTYKTALPLETIKEYSNLEKFIDLYKSDFPEHILTSIKAYLDIIPDFKLNGIISEKALNFHQNLVQPIINVIDEILGLNILSNDVNAIHISSFLDRDKSIYIFNAETKVHQRFIAALLRQSFAKKLGAPLEENHAEKHFSRKVTIGVCNIFLREIALPRGMAVVSAQARSLGMSMTYSYSSLSRMREIIGIELDSILANTNTKIIEANENDAIEYLNLYKKEILLDDIEEKFNIKDLKVKNDYVWIMKHDDVSQISYKNNFRYINAK